MNRQKLIAEVKAGYARKADLESRDSFTGGTVQPEVYYERLLNQVLEGIDAGRFDRFGSGQEIIDAVAKDHPAYGIHI